jgi:Cu/Ag efflux protein CusF
MEPAMESGREAEAPLERRRRNIVFTVKFVLVSTCILVAPTCLRAVDNDTAKDIRFFGRVVAVHASDGTATIRHGKIPGFVEAMTMDYQISPRSKLEKLHPGDDIRATARAGESTLYNVIVVSPAPKR